MLLLAENVKIHRTIKSLNYTLELQLDLRNFEKQSIDNGKEFK